MRKEMPEISRRDLLYSGFGFSASSLAAQLAWRRNGMLSGYLQDVPAEAVAAVAPREHLLFDFAWRFTFGNGDDPSKDLGFGYGQGDFAKTGDFEFAKAGFDDSKWRSDNLPHDWAVELPFVWDEEQKSHGYKPLGRRYPESSVGWYRREFDMPASDQGRRIWVEFDGAFRDVLVFVNGFFIGRNDNGYAPFRFDLSGYLNCGEKNYIVVRVDASFGDGWFYEGAGIYRHVWLNKMNQLHLGKWESVVRSTVSGGSATLALETIVENQGKQDENAKVNWQILDAAGKTVATAESPAQQVAAYGSVTFGASARLANPALWSVEVPNLYTAIVTVSTNGTSRDAERIIFGVRTAHFDAQKGFFLNGKALKIQGTCNHQDHAGVGAALPDRLQSFRLAARGASSESAACPGASRRSRFGKQDRARSRDILLAQPDRALLTRKQRPQEQKQALSQVVPLPRRAGAQQAAEDQAQIEGSHMDQLPLEDVVVFAQMGTPHAPGVVAVSEAAFHQFATPPQ